MYTQGALVVPGAVVGNSWSSKTKPTTLTGLIILPYYKIQEESE